MLKPLGSLTVFTGRFMQFHGKNLQTHNIWKFLKTALSVISPLHACDRYNWFYESLFLLTNDGLWNGRDQEST